MVFPKMLGSNTMVSWSPRVPETWLCSCEVRRRCCRRSPRRYRLAEAEFTSLIGKDLVPRYKEVDRQDGRDLAVFQKLGCGQESRGPEQTFPAYGSGERSAGPFSTSRGMT